MNDLNIINLRNNLIELEDKIITFRQLVRRKKLSLFLTLRALNNSSVLEASRGAAEITIKIADSLP